MTWTRIGDDWPDRPAVLEVSRSARLLLIELTVYANKHTTDGRVPTAAIPRSTDAVDWSADLAELERASLATPDEDGSAWHVDWTDQESAEQVNARKEFNAAKQKRYRDRKARHERGDHSACDPKFCRAAVTRNATSNGDGHVTGLVTPSPPVPARPLGRDRDRDAESDSAGAPSLRLRGMKCDHGVVNGIALGQCAEDSCTRAWEYLRGCDEGKCFAKYDDEDPACTGLCWLAGFHTGDNRTMEEATS